MKRRELLYQLSTLAAGTALAPGFMLGSGARANSKADQPLAWRNWSGSQSCRPQHRKAPASLAELQDLIASTSGKVRAVGAGHSFSPLVPTDDTLVSLSRISGVLDHDPEKLQATVAAGTRLGAIGGPLAERGQAMINMPDIDEQSLAGAVATATHGTGADLSCLSDYIAGLTLVTATGDLLHCSNEENPDVFAAARVGLGSLGIISDITLRNTRPYRLKSETSVVAIDDLLDSADSLANNNRNFEFFYIPFSSYGMAYIHNITDEPTTDIPKPDDNEGTQTLKDLRDWLSWSSTLRGFVLKNAMEDVPTESRVSNSWESYANERNVRFNEMEFHLPRDEAISAFREIRTLLERDFPEVFFPIEFRFIKGDNSWLSPFYQRDSCSIAIHRFHEEDYGPFFKAAEPIFRKYNGRPHWGKLNTVTAKEFEQLYPRWSDFKEVRQQLDPEGKFLNPYLAGLFGTG